MTDAYIDFVLDDRLSNGGGRLLDIKDSDGTSLLPGAWIDRADGTVALRLTQADISHHDGDRQHLDASRIRADFAAQHPNCAAAEVWGDVDGQQALLLMQCGTPTEHH
jgi:hypothetical protein